MFGRVIRSIGAVAALATLVYGCSGAQGQSSLPLAGSNNPSSTTSHFRLATSAEKSEPRPSLAAGNRAASTSLDGYTLVTSLGSDDQLDFTQSSATCNTSILAAPWYVALADTTLMVQSTTVNACAPRGVKTPVAASNLYIVQVDIGFFYLDAQPISGPATYSNGQWTFTPLVKATSFQGDSIYAFFVASYNGSGSPTGISL